MVTGRRLALVVAVLAIAVAIFVVAAWNLTDTRESVPPIVIDVG